MRESSALQITDREHRGHLEEKSLAKAAESRSPDQKYKVRPRQPL